MIKFNKTKINRQDRFASIKNLPSRPSFMQNPTPAPDSILKRAQLTSMEMGSTCRRNPRISTVR